ncbi:hypothetical protein [Microbulbifer agarilyticus]
MFAQYFNDFEPLEEFDKEFVSLWDGWLGEENFHKLDEVTVEEFERFNTWIRFISKNYNILEANLKTETLAEISDVESILSDFESSQEKTSAEFLRIVVPELECIISEEWDFTYIIWHKNNGAVDRLRNSIKDAELKSFSE